MERGSALKKLIRRLAIITKNRRGQDLIEYALIVGLVAVTAGVAMPNIADNIGTVMHHVRSVLFRAQRAGRPIG
jgi:Flp pilus assembly pilin Flp